MSAPADSSDGPKRQLTLLDSTCIIIGIIIGAGVFETTPLIAASIHEPWLMIAAWVLGGVVALVGALCYTELTTTYPFEGGDYVFLTKAYGHRTGFLFAWANFWIIRPGNIGAMAFIFARYAERLWPLGTQGQGLIAYAGAAVAVLTVVNVLGVTSGKWTQNALTILKAAGLVVIIVVGGLLVTPASPAVSGQPSVANDGGFAFAMILIMFAFGGWNEMSYVAAELRNPRATILRAFVLGTIGVTCIYVLVNLAAIRALTYAGVARSPAFAADMMGMQFSHGGATFISLLICVSCLGAVNGMIFTGSRIFYAVGTEHRRFEWLGTWDQRRGTPARSLLLQALITLGLMSLFRLYENGFERLVVFTGVFFWFFFLLIGISLFILRRTDPNISRPYRVIMYPMTPILFCLSSLYMLYASLSYAMDQGGPEGFWAIVVMTVGLILTVRRSQAR